MYSAGFRDRILPHTADSPEIIGFRPAAGVLLFWAGMHAATEFATATAPHATRLFRLGLRLTREPSDAADLVQEALCKAWTSWERFDRNGNVGAYLSRILMNAFISRHRHMRVVHAVEARPDLVGHLFSGERLAEAEAADGLPAHGLSDECLAALEELPEHYRRVVELVDVGGMPYRDAASALGVPLGTVMSRLHRARRILRAQLGGYARAYGYGQGVPDAA
jgi:RNA polymerase sigma-70 factor (ECF subfamily)